MRTSAGALHPVVWAEVGMQVWIRFRPDGSDAVKALRCTVRTATGDVLRVVSEAYGVDRWKAIGDCYVLDGDPHARAA